MFCTACKTELMRNSGPLCDHCREGMHDSAVPAAVVDATGLDFKFEYTGGNCTAMVASFVLGQHTAEVLLTTGDATFDPSVTDHAYVGVSDWRGTFAEVEGNPESVAERLALVLDAMQTQREHAEGTLAYQLATDVIRVVGGLTEPY